jgi:AMP-binding enzyme
MNVATARQDSPAESFDVIGSRDAGTLWGLFCERLRRSPDRPAYRDWDMARGQWCDHTWRAVGDRVDRFRPALIRSRLDPGDRVGILLPNVTDWICRDLAAHACGFVVVALYPHDSPGNHAFILGHADVRTKSTRCMQRTDLNTCDRLGLRSRRAPLGGRRACCACLRVGEPRQKVRPHEKGASAPCDPERAFRRRGSRLPHPTRCRSISWIGIFTQSLSISASNARRTAGE